MTSPTVDVPAQHSRFAVEGWLLWLQVAMGLSFIAVAPLFPLIIDDYGIDNATTSLLIGVGELVFAIATIPGGVLAARFGWRRATIFGGALMSIMVLAPLADSFALLLLLRVVFAVGAAIAIGSLPAAVMSWFPGPRAAADQRRECRRPEHRRDALGVHGGVHRRPHRLARDADGVWARHARRHRAICVVRA